MRVSGNRAETYERQRENGIRDAKTVDGRSGGGLSARGAGTFNQQP